MIYIEAIVSIIATSIKKATKQETTTLITVTSFFKIISIYFN
jgi:hypothetical protein